MSNCPRELQGRRIISSGVKQFLIFRNDGIDYRNNHIHNSLRSSGLLVVILSVQFGKLKEKAVCAHVHRLPALLNNAIEGIC